jgi:hypothetical protein
VINFKFKGKLDKSSGSFHRKPSPILEKQFSELLLGKKARFDTKL